MTVRGDELTWRAITALQTGAITVPEAETLIKMLGEARPLLQATWPRFASEVRALERGLFHGVLEQQRLSGKVQLLTI